MTREEAIKILRKEIECLSHSKCEDCILEKVCDPMITTPLDTEYIEAFAMAISALSENNGGWNPLESDEEGMIIGSLPEEGKEVFITVYGQVEIDSFGCDVEYDESIGECRCEWFCENNDIENVRAWMPLPEPYKAERGE